MKITIVGSGSNGLATASWFVAKGFEVCLYDSSEQFEDLMAIQKQKGILVRGNGHCGCFMPHSLTTEISDAVSFGDLIIFCTSADRHPEVIEASLPYIKTNQVLLFNPGNFGAWLMRHRLEDNHCDAVGVLTADVSGCIWACRRTGPGEVIIAFPLEGPKCAAAYPAADTPRLMAALKDVLEIKPSTNILEAALNSPNVVSHVGGTILNAVRIEQMGKQFAYYLHGLAEPVIRLVDGLETERNDIMSALGLRVYSEHSEGFTRCLMEYDKHRELDVFRSLVGPCSVDHRYVTEDAACGVSMLISLGNRIGMELPLTKAMLEISNALLNRDFLNEGATLEKFKISGTTPEEILSAF